MKKTIWSLQLFADGEAAGAEQTAKGETTAAGDADQQDNAQAENEFNELIKGKYKDIYSKNVQSIIDKRFKQTKALEEQVKANTEINARLGAKYGIDAGDTAALAQAISEDDSWLEDAAYEQGLTVDQYKILLEGEQAKAELENLKRQERREQLTEYFNTQAEAVKTKYNDPGFDFWTLYNSNRQFAGMINAGVDVDTAYRVVNIENISAKVADAAAARAKRAVTNDIMANGRRPVEGGVKPNQAPVSSQINIRGLTDQQIDDYIEQAKRGKVITFR